MKVSLLLTPSIYEGLQTIGLKTTTRSPNVTVFNVNKGHWSWKRYWNLPRIANLQIWWKIYDVCQLVFSYQGQQAAFFARGRKIIHEGSLKTTRGKFQPEVWNEVSNRGLKFPPSGLQTVPSGWFSDQVRKKPPCPRSEWCFLHLGRQKTSVSIFKIGVPLFVIDFWNRTTQVYR